MRKKIVAGNWKMNKTLQEGIDLVNQVNAKLGSKSNDALVIFCTPFIHLTEIAGLVDNSTTFLSAQNCASEVSGAYTGETAVSMISSTGASHTIIGHSERRTYYGEDDEVLNKKVKLALDEGLIPIFCIGEVLEERNSNIHFDVVKNQLQKGLFSLSKEQFSKVIVAYEPVWAIGTGVTATPDQAQEMHKYIREQIASKYDSVTADDTTILYGGSCKPSNAGELFQNPDVDGGLIGGASLIADDFIGIINAF
jgi:triosephosphate isomerase